MNDVVNGAFEMLGGLFIALSIAKLRRDKKVAGVSWLHMGFFTCWGFWNLWFYPSVGCWISTIGGVGVVGTNTVYLVMLLWYGRRTAR